MPRTMTMTMRIPAAMRTHFINYSSAYLLGGWQVIAWTSSLPLSVALEEALTPLSRELTSDIIPPHAHQPPNTSYEGRVFAVIHTYLNRFGYSSRIVPHQSYEGSGIEVFDESRKASRRIPTRT